MENISIARENLQTTGEGSLLVEEFIMYKIGQGIQKTYFPILVPVGIVGNCLSFLVMVQQNNKQKSISIYISALAISDSVALVLNLLTYLNTVHGVVIPPAGLGDCVKNVFAFAAPLCSNLFVVSMTFDRFYGIIRPHKAASFNTVERARIMVIVIVIFCSIYNIPHYFLSAVEGTHCTPYGNAMQYVYGQLYFWSSFVIGFCFPFLSLLIMNCFIINTLRTRSSLLQKSNISSKGQTEGQLQGQVQSSSVRTSEIQIYIILLLITFSFLLLTTPGQVILLYIMTVDYNSSPEDFAKYYLLENIGEKMYYTNCGVNFFLYVLSGKRFRTDLVTLLKCRRENKNHLVSADQTTKVTSLETVNDS